MGKDRHLPSFTTAIPQTNIDFLNAKYGEYLAVKGVPNSPETPRCLNRWANHFENAVNASKCIPALLQLQELPCPNKRLEKKIETKIKQFRFPNPGAGMDISMPAQTATA